MDETSQAIGQLQGRMDSHEQRTARIEAKLDSVDEKLDRLLAVREHSKGARKATTAIVTGAGSVLGAVIGYVLTWWTSRP